MKTLTALLIVAFTAAPALTFAAGPTSRSALKEVKPAPAAAKVKYKKVQELIFTDDEVTATRAGGAGEVIQVRAQTKTSSLIHIRGNFLPELVKSAENI